MRCRKKALPIRTYRIEVRQECDSATLGRLAASLLPSSPILRRYSGTAPQLTCASRSRFRQQSMLIASKSTMPRLTYWTKSESDYEIQAVAVGTRLEK